MFSAKSFLALWALVGAVQAIPPIPINAIGIPGPLRGIAVVPAGLTVSAAARAAGARQIGYQIVQAQRASVTNAINQAQQANSIGNQANNQRVRDAILQANAERVLAAGNNAQALRNALSQAQNAQTQVAQSNAAAAHNIAIQGLQINNAAGVQTILSNNAQSLAGALGGAPILVAGGPAPVLVAGPRGPIIGPIPALALGRGPGPVLAIGVKGRGPGRRLALRDQLAVEAPAVVARLAASPLAVGVGWGRRG